MQNASEVTHKPKLISVLVATYNRAELLKRAIASVLAQTYPHFELCIVDDGSTDATEASVKSFADPRIRFIPSEHVGRSKARNIGIQACRGDYIAFLDSDDAFAPTKLETQLRALEKTPDAKVSYTSATVIDEIRGVELKDLYKASHSGDIYYDIALYIPLTVLLPTVMADAQLVKSSGGFDTQLNRFEDTDFWRRLAKQTHFLAIDERLSIIYTHSDNQMEAAERLIRDLLYYVKKVLREDQDKDFVKLKHLASNFYYHYALAMYAGRVYRRESAALFQEVVNFYPKSRKARLYLFVLKFPPLVQGLILGAVYRARRMLWLLTCAKNKVVSRLRSSDQKQLK